MMNRIFVFFVCFWSVTCVALPSTPVACPQAYPDDHPGFCASFKSVAQCHCQEAELPRPICQDINLLYARLISMFGSLQRVCEFQHDTSTQICIDDWNCYRLGGRDSQGRLCSSTGKACQ